MVMNPFVFANVREYMHRHMLFVFLMADLRGWLISRDFRCLMPCLLSKTASFHRLIAIGIVEMRKSSKLCTGVSVSKKK